MENNGDGGGSVRGAKGTGGNIRKAAQPVSPEIHNPLAGHYLAASLGYGDGT